MACIVLRIVQGITLYNTHYAILHIEDSAPTKDEIENVSSEMKDVDVEVLAREMDMEYSIHEAKEDKKRHRNLAYSVIYDFADHEGGTRYELAKFLRSAKFVDMSQRLTKSLCMKKGCYFMLSLVHVFSL